MDTARLNPFHQIEVPIEQTALAFLAHLIGVAIASQVFPPAPSTLFWLGMLVPPVYATAGLALLVGVLVATLGKSNVIAKTTSPLHIHRIWVIVYYVLAVVVSAILTWLVQTQEDNPYAWIPVFATISAWMIGLPSAIVAFWLQAGQ